MAKETTFCFRVTAHGRNDLEAIAFAGGVTASELTRRVMERFVNGYKNEVDWPQVLEEYDAAKKREAAIQERKIKHLESMLSRSDSTFASERPASEVEPGSADSSIAQETSEDLTSSQEPASRNVDPGAARPRRRK